MYILAVILPMLYCHLEEKLDALNETFIDQKIMKKSKLTKITLNAEYADDINLTVMLMLT